MTEAQLIAELQRACGRSPEDANELISGAVCDYFKDKGLSMVAHHFELAMESAMPIASDDETF